LTSHDEWHNNWHIESGAGATTIAAGLAGALSETGGGKVLLVDLTGKQGAAHHISQRMPACSLFDVLREEKCESPASQQQFQVASVGDLNGSSLPARTKAFDALMPKLKGSDYDFVVFDLPPLQANSIAFRLAGYLDQPLLVAEAERTHRDALKHVVSILQDSNANANLAVVLNKTVNFCRPG
jgi:Mrp family chromosome partitioning ATPase